MPRLQEKLERSWLRLSRPLDYGKTLPKAITSDEALNSPWPHQNSSLSRKSPEKLRAEEKMERNGGDAIISSYFILDGDPSLVQLVFLALSLFSLAWERVKILSSKRNFTFSLRKKYCKLEATFRKFLAIYFSAFYARQYVGVISSLPLPRIANIRDRHYENGHDPYWIIGEVKVPDFVTTLAEGALFSNEVFRSPRKKKHAKNLVEFEIGHTIIAFWHFSQSYPFKLWTI